MAKRRRPVPPPFEEVEDFLTEYARRWAYLHHADMDDLLSLAAGVYLDRCGAWDGVRPFLYDLRYYVWSAFGMYCRDRKRRAAAVPLDRGADPDTVPVHKSPFCVAHFTEGMPDDAAAVVRLVFDTPADFLKAMRADQGGWTRGGKRPNRASNPYVGYKAGISRYLRSKGWGEKRVLASFRAISEALTSC